jgi:hypothetical protein
VTITALWGEEVSWEKRVSAFIPLPPIASIHRHGLAAKSILEILVLLLKRNSVAQHRKPTCRPTTWEGRHPNLRAANRPPLGVKYVASCTVFFFSFFFPFSGIPPSHPTRAGRSCCAFAQAVVVAVAPTLRLTYSEEFLRNPSMIGG